MGRQTCDDLIAEVELPLSFFSRKVIYKYFEHLPYARTVIFGARALTPPRVQTSGKPLHKHKQIHLREPSIETKATV